MLGEKQFAMKQRHDKVRGSAFEQKRDHHWRPSERDLAVMLALQLRLGLSKTEVIRLALSQLADAEKVQ